MEQRQGGVIDGQRHGTLTRENMSFQVFVSRKRLTAVGTEHHVGSVLLETTVFHLDSGNAIDDARKNKSATGTSEGGLKAASNVEAEDVFGTWTSDDA